jgi:autotransporter-associated beta strand protein
MMLPQFMLSGWRFAPSSGRMPVSHLIMSALLMMLAAASAQAIPAFPGAEGFGANASGGRGGAVYTVTTLNDTGPGSFRDAVSQPNRIVVFAVGGIIRINSPIVVRPNITIAGQTAPGEGITIYGDRISYSNADNTITRYIRYREGINGDSGTDAVGIASGTTMIFDHVSASWGRDETFSITGSTSNITLQDCIIGQGLLVHSAGGLMETSGGVSIFRSLYIDNWMRNPKVKGVNDYRNNVVYNWGGGGGYIPAGDSAGMTYANLINNAFIAGPNTGNEGPFKSGNANYHLYHAGNLQDLNRDGAYNPVPVTDSSFPTLTIVSTPFAYPAPTTLLSATEAVAHVLAHAGASLHRDHADTYMLAELASFGTSGAHIFNEAEIGGVGTVAGGVAPKDTDGDGMPDWWEAAAGTNPWVADHNDDIDNDGYTNIENYLNALAPAGVAGVAIDGISDDTGAFAGDGITADTTLVLHGTSVSHATVTISRVDLGVIGSATADAAGQWTFDYRGTPLADRHYAFQARIGNRPPTRAFVVQVDATPAAAPVITSVVVDPELTINGTAEPGSEVQVMLAGGGLVGTAVADDLGNWTAPYTGAPLAAGSHTFHASAIDLAGNAGGASTSYTVDTGLAAPVFTGISTDTGTPSDQVTSDTTLVFRGTSAPHAVVSLSRAGVGPIGSTAAAADGTWVFDYTGTTLAQGAHAFAATASNGGASSPSSAPFVVTIDATRPVISSIRRQDPPTAATTASTVVFRVAFAEPVSGVDAGDFALTLSGVTATLTSLTPVSSTVYDATVTGAAGDGTVRLDLRSSGTGIVDVAGNAISGGYTAGQTYTIRLPGSGVWLSDASGETWSHAGNWADGIVANGAGATAEFGARDVEGEIVVQLDSPRTLGRVVFGDLDFATPPLWRLSDNGSAANTLTLAGPAPNLHVNGATSASGDTVDVPAANAYPAELDVVLAGNSGFTKTGVGTLEITKPATITGPLAVNKGIVQVGPGGFLAPSSVHLLTSQQLRVAGGTFSTTGDVTWNSGTGTGIIVSSGEGHFGRILPSNTRNSFVRVTGGTFTATEIKFPRSGDSQSQALAAGIQISGGQSTIGTIGLGTDNSWGAMTISGGQVTVTGPINVGFQATAGRGGDVVVSGGEFNVLDASATGGLILARNPITDTPARANAPNNVANFRITGGVSNVARIALGYNATSTAGSATVSLIDGELNLGAGGIVKNGTSGMTTSITLGGGVLGAVAPWSTTHPIEVAGTTATLALRAADAAGAAVDYTLAGALFGSGGFAKTGAGTLTLAGANTFTGSVAVHAGTLLVTGSLAAGGELTINSGGTLVAEGAIAKTVVLNGGTLAPDGGFPVSGVTWNGGSLLTIRLGASGVSDRLVVNGPLTRGAVGTYPIAFAPDEGFAAGNTYTLATFTSTDFVASDFTAVGLPEGHVAIFSVTSTSLQVTVKALAPLALADLFQWYDGQPRVPTALTTPADLNVVFTFSPGAGAPVYPGSYDVVAEIVHPVYAGSTTGTLVISTAVLTRRAPTLNGFLDGSVQVLQAENVTVKETATIARDLLVPGTPKLVVKGQPTMAGILTGPGADTPSTHTITINDGAVLRHLVRQVDGLVLADVAAPLPPAGTRSVALNKVGQSVGSWNTVKNLTLNGGAGTVTVPAGAYGAFVANGGTALVLGTPGATEPEAYHFQSLTLNGASELRVAGPVIVTLGQGLAANGRAGDAEHPEWLTLLVHSGGLTLNTGARFDGHVVAPAGTVAINSGATLRGTAAADRLTLNSGGVFEESTP